MLDAHAHVMQVKLCKANTRGVTTVKLLEAILLSRTCVPKFISTICTSHSQPYEHCLVEIGCKLDIIERNL